MSVFRDFFGSKFENCEGGFGIGPGTGVPVKVSAHNGS